MMALYGVKDPLSKGQHTGQRWYTKEMRIGQKCWLNMRTKMSWFMCSYPRKKL